MNINSKYLGGFVFYKSKKDILFSKLFMKVQSKDFFIEVLKDELTSGSDWCTGLIKTNIPFRREDFQPPYNYNFYFIEKESSSFSILLTENKELANRLLTEIHNLVITINPIKINTENVIKHVDSYLFKRNSFEERFVVNYLYAKILGMQDKLASITLYGKDVLKSALFINYQENFNSLTCGLAIEESSYNFNEISRISNDGYISFYANDDIFENVKIVTEFLHSTKSFILI